MTTSPADGQHCLPTLSAILWGLLPRCQIALIILYMQTVVPAGSNFNTEADRAANLHCNSIKPIRAELSRGRARLAQESGKEALAPRTALFPHIGHNFRASALHRHARGSARGRFGRCLSEANIG
jgi:hypothetical protein